MLLEYTTLDGEKHQVKASLSYDHPDSNWHPGNLTRRRQSP